MYTKSCGRGRHASVRRPSWPLAVSLLRCSPVAPQVSCWPTHGTCRRRPRAMLGTCGLVVIAIGEAVTFADALSPSLLKHLLKGEGGGQHNDRTLADGQVVAMVGTAIALLAFLLSLVSLLVHDVQMTSSLPQLQLVSATQVRATSYSCNPLWITPAAAVS